MQPVTPTPLSVCGIVTSMSCPTSSLSLSTAACPPGPPGAQQLLLFLMHFSDSRIQFFIIRWIKSGQSALLIATSLILIIMFQDGMGNLQLNQDGIRLEGISEFLLPLYVNEIQSRRVSCSLCSSQKLSMLINTLKRWWTRNNYHWQNCVWKALVWKELSAADELVLISQCWGSYDQFINNKGQLPFEPWLDNTLMLLYICAWKEEITLLLSLSFAPLLHLLISCHPPAVHYQGLPSAGDG